MEDKKLKKEIRIALELLGYQNFKYELKHRDCSYYDVYVNGKPFGIWDSRKKTFVD